MSETTVQLAILVPEAFVDEFAREVAGEQGCRIEHRTIAAAPSDQILGFEPVTSGALVWMVVKFVGDAAVQIALGVVGSYVYEELQRRAKKPDAFELPIRLPDGHRIEVQKRDSASLARLQEILESQGVE